MKRNESPGHALKRVCHWHVGRALKYLQKANLPAAVHDVRKEIKRMRALFRLTRGLLSHDAYRKTAKVMRLAAKPLATSRDARVTKKTFEALAHRHARQFPNFRSTLELHSHLGERNLKDFDLSIVTKFLLKKVCDQLDSLDIQQAGWADVKNCLLQSYTRGRGSYLLAVKRSSPGHLHRWRKRVKDFWYQLDFLCPAWPPKTKRMLAGLEKLGDQLGDDHDLVLLETFGKEHCQSNREFAALNQLINLKRRQYHAAIQPLGSHLYSKSPKEVVAQVELDWKSWHKH